MKTQVQRRKIATLDVLEVPGPGEGPSIVLFHGYGASAFDLLPLHQELSPPPGTSWYFPNGPLKVPLGPGIYGRAWFPIDLVALEEATAKHSYQELVSQLPDGFEASREQGWQFLEEIMKEKGISHDKIILGGFSQGAMLATGISLKAKQNFAKLLILSGTLLAREEWRRLSLEKPGMQFFQSHGRQDPLLPFSLAEELQSLLSTAGWTGSFIPFEGGHEIPLEVLHGLNQFLTASASSLIRETASRCENTPLR